ncbi:fibroblast growth factor receptor 3-like isoform X2 [Sitodiplosis mosellana]|uniref:fibroblast growth factor receptor 3-like isoform X2 n=1 Tax=Sitodiplosis mosellana TaxID=263140 RepID=UPI0024440AC3|nr:fibroblast growth factor receptor 3-like isoform X2 [Sitodiplosis mosellana]
MFHSMIKTNWFKNGKPYPWSSSLILYPQAENQTIYTRHATVNDNGNYTCVIRNDTHKMEHIIEFTVQASLPDSPLATYKPHDQYIELGNEARFYCEAFVGSIRLPDSKNFISWFQVFEDGMEQNIKSQELIRREDDQIVGALLIVPAVELHNYGRYLCRIENGNAAHRLEMSAWLFGTPVHARNDSLFPALVLAISAVTLVILLMFAIKYISVYATSYHRRDKKLCHSMNSSESIRIREVV